MFGAVLGSGVTWASLSRYTLAGIMGVAKSFIQQTTDESFRMKKTSLDGVIGSLGRPATQKAKAIVQK